MQRESREEEVVEAPPEKKPKLTLVVILSMLTGALLTFSIAGTVYHFQSGAAREAELATTKDELARKTLLLDEQQEQIAGLSRQVHALKEFAVAKASAVAAATVSETSTPGTSSPTSAPAPETEKNIPAVVPVSRKKAKAESQDCQLTGKSQEEQAETLQRCMQTIDGKGSRR